MDLIVTHTLGDFDALSSLLAAKKLYPRADLILPRSPEKQVRDFLSLYQDVFKLKDERYYDFSRVKRLIIVDTRLKSRLGKAGNLLNKKNRPRIHIYDHHPRTKDDIKADKDIFSPVGATVTLLLEEIKKRNIKISPIEATIMGLGIYEDTGLLTFRTTKKDDIDILSYLFSKGLNLNIVAHYLNRKLTEDELELLVKLIDSTQTKIINGVHIAVAAIRHSEYIPDLAILTHRLVDIENFNVVFVLVKINGKIQMVARSRLPQVDVNKIASRFSGGGHASAASGIIRKLSLNQAKKKLFKLLDQSIKPELLAKDIMSAPVKTVNSSISITEARRLMTRYNIGGMPVLQKKKLAGMITRSDLDKAIYHGFGHSRIKGYMSTQLISVKPSTPISQIRQIMFSNDIGRVPVMESGRLLGIISRGDVLKVIQQNLGQLAPVSRPAAPKAIKHKPTTRDISSKLKTKLPSRIYKLLKRAGALADKNNYRIYVVGGFVRDILLGYENYDVDLVIEENGIDFAREFARKYKAAVVSHERFSTAIIIMPEGFKIDVATCRREFYEYPAALPKVELGSIENDLLRRDFTINAMAVSLNKGSFGRLIDYSQGLRDLKEGKIRVLHNLSFVEDPTRIFRAVRFEQRFDFKIEPKTEHLIKTAVDEDMFEKIAGERLRDEIIPILSEPDPLKGILRLKQLHELRFIHSHLKFTKTQQRTFTQIKKNLRWAGKNLTEPLEQWLVYFLCLIDSLSPVEAKKVAARMVLSKKHTEIVVKYKRDTRKLTNSLAARKKIKPSRLYKLLKPYSQEALLSFMAKSTSKALGKRIKRYLRTLKDVELKTTGRDLIKLGYKPSPEFNKILNRLFYAKLDKGLKTKRDELSYLRENLLAGKK